MKRRNTPSKEAVMAILTSNRKAMSQDAIEQQLKIDMDRATIYRVLNRFCEDGVAHRIVAEDGKQYFAVPATCEGRDLTDNHLHFRCTCCQTIECLPVPIHFSVPKGYYVDHVHCVLSGLCKSCS